MKTILGTDGSAYSLLAEAILTKIPSLRESEVIVAAVTPPPALGLMGVDPLASTAVADELQKSFQRDRDKAQAEAEASAARLRAVGLNTRVELREGEPGHELMELAAEEKADLIAVGSHGIGGLKGLLLGSVAKALVGSAPCSVMVARCAEDENPESKAQKLAAKAKLTVGVAVDGSDGSDVALKAVMNQGKGTFEAIFAMCAEPLAVLPVGIEPADFSSVYHEDEGRVIEIVKRADHALEGYAPLTKGVHKLGRPKEVISDLAIELGLDLVVLGASRHGFFERFLIGSVSMDVAGSAPCPVWVVRPPAA